ncbi:MAG: hypothetical protein QOJ98_1940, partial [Acidobacteriota bacterium]|nr:hypothetical protein [Acidobacteriota bacterium]
MLNQLSDRRLALQPDIYQRYSLLARLTDILSGEGSGTLTLLDVGSGPVALTEVFVSPRFDIVRADISRFDDPSIVLLHPGEPLPFEDGAFDVAVAIEVLEHLPPAQRPSLIRELQRVSRQATIVCCPIDTPEVVEAERQFSAWAQAVSGRDVGFLVEHDEHGLPDAAEVVSWFGESGPALVADNAPLDEWLAFNLLDLIYACDLGDHEAKGRFATAVNVRAPLARAGAAHYRRFFCAFRSPAHAATAARTIDAAKSPDPSDPRRLVRELATGILGWRREVRERSTRDVEAIHRQVGDLDAALSRFKEALAEKDAHIGKLDDTLVELRDAIGEKDAHIQTLDRQKEAHRLELEAQAKATRTRADVAEARATAHERELQAMRTSRSWRLTAPLRRFAEALRYYRTLQTALAGAFARLRRSVRERTNRRDHYALAAGSGLFDATWYRQRYPDVGRSNLDPLLHYLKRGAWEGRDPHPLFDSSYYLQSNPDVDAAGLNPLVHFLAIGGLEGRAPHPDFDASFYLAGHPDVAAARMNPLRHYLSSGALEGRSPHPDFD